MIELIPSTMVGVFGPVASGKTHLIREWLKTQNRFVANDITGEMVDDPSVTHVWSSPRKLYAKIKGNPYYFRVAYHPGRDLQEDFYWTLNVLWRIDTEKILVCDEFHEICPNGGVNRDVEMMLRYARHARLGFIGASQRIADVHKLFTSGCRMCIIFYTQEARDIIAVEDRWGKPVAEMVSNLRPLIYDDATRTVKQVPQCVVCAKGKAPFVYDFSEGKNLEQPANSDSRTSADNEASAGNCEDSGSMSERSDDGVPE